MELNKSVLRLLIDNLMVLGLLTEETFSGFNVRIMDKIDGYKDLYVHKNKIRSDMICSNYIKTIAEFVHEYNITSSNRNEIIELATLNKVFLSDLS
jgi:hypothetical protein